MALKVGDRVKQTSTTTGTGTITLNGAAPTGFSNFRDYLSDGDTTYYVIEDGTNYEIGLGTFNTGGSATADTIARASDANVYRSTNSNNRVNWSSGTRSVFISQPSDKAVFLDGSGDLTLTGDVNIDKLLTVDNQTSNEMVTTFLGTGGKVHIGAFGHILQQNVNDSTSNFWGTASRNNGDLDIAYGTSTTNGVVDTSNNVISIAKTGETTFLGDVTFTGDNYNIVWDKSDNALEVAQNGKIKFGVGTEIYYNHANNTLIDHISGNDLYITNEVDDKSVFIRTDNGSGSVTPYFKADGSTGEALLYHYGSEKLKTTSTGATVTGNLIANSADINGALDIPDSSSGGILRIGNGVDFQFYHNGSNSVILNQTNTFFLINSGSGNFIFDSQGNDTNFIFKGTDNNVDTTFLTLDGSEGGTAIFNNDIKLSDAGYAYFGASDDLLIGHGGGVNNSVISNYTNHLTLTNYADDKSVIIYSDNGSGSIAKYLQADGSTGEAQLYHYGSEKLATKSTGVEVTGNLVADSLDIDDVSIDSKTITMTGSTNDTATLTAGTNGSLTVTTTDVTLANAYQRFVADGFIEFDANSSITLDSLSHVIIGHGDPNNTNIIFKYGTTTFAQWNGVLGSILYGDLNLRTSDGGILQLQTSDTSINDGDVLGELQFRAPLSSGFGDGALTAASIVAEADATFSSTVNQTDLVFKLGSSEAATEKMRLTHEGQLQTNSVDISNGLISNTSGADANSLSDLTGDFGTWIRVGDGVGSKTMSNGFGIKLHDAGVIHWSIGGLGTDFKISKTSANGAQLFPSSRNDYFSISTNGLTSLSGLTVNGDVTFTGANYNIVWDASQNSLEFADNANLKIGDGEDIRIFHDGTNNIFRFGTDKATYFQTDNTIFITKNLNSETMAKFIGDGAVELYHNNVKKFETTSTGIKLESTDGGTGADPIIELYRNSASPADLDALGEIHFFGNDAGGVKTKYAEIISVAGSDDEGNERGRLRFNIVQNATEDTLYLDLSFNAVNFYKALNIHTNQGIYFEGTTANTNETNLRVVDPTQDNTITLPNATGTVLTTGNSDTPTTTTSSSDADFVLIDDGGVMKKITPSNLGIGGGGGGSSFTSNITAKTSSGAALILQNSKQGVSSGTDLGKIQFQAPDESNGGDAILVSAEILAEGSGSFTSTANPTDLIFKLGTSGLPTEVARMHNTGQFQIKETQQTYTGSDMLYVAPAIYASFFDNTGGLDVSSGAGIIFDSTKQTSDSDIFIFDSSTGEVTVKRAGSYQITYDATTAIESGGGSSRSETKVTLQEKVGGSGSFSDVTGTTSYVYNRTAFQGEATSTCTIIHFVLTNSVFRVFAQREGGTSVIKTTPQGSRLNFLLVGGQT